MTSTNSHRVQLDEALLRAVLAAGGIDPARLTEWGELAQATYNTAYLLRLTGGRGLVLKIAPDPAAPALTHEHGIMRTEVEFYRAAAGIVPVPLVVHADFGRELLGSDLLLMTELPGTSWHDLTVDPATETRLRTELGTLVARLHGIHGTAFGYPQRTTTTNWRTAFTAMVDDLLNDAAHHATALPHPIERIRASITANADVLDEVTTPVLVHFDLWPGNILIDDIDGVRRISGLVDGERAFWGDPLADFVSLALFADIADDPAFIAGYGGSTFDTAARTRIALYRVYLYLIMLVEGGPRGYTGPERAATVAVITRHVNAALAELDG
jgi:aminoglycoside phosphotransferase (APT) family kinase protein